MRRFTSVAGTQARGHAARGRGKRGKIRLKRKGDVPWLERSEERRRIDDSSHTAAPSFLPLSPLARLSSPTVSFFRFPPSFFHSDFHPLQLYLVSFIYLSLFLSSPLSPSPFVSRFLLLCTADSSYYTRLRRGMRASFVRFEQHVQPMSPASVILRRSFACAP